MEIGLDTAHLRIAEPNLLLSPANNLLCIIVANYKAKCFENPKLLLLLPRLLNHRTPIIFRPEIWLMRQRIR